MSHTTLSFPLNSWEHRADVCPLLSQHTEDHPLIEVRAYIWHRTEVPNFIHVIFVVCI